MRLRLRSRAIAVPEEPHASIANESHPSAHCAHLLKLWMKGTPHAPPAPTPGSLGARLAGAAFMDAPSAAPQTPLNCDMVVIGASAGGVDALRRLAASLPGNYRGSLFIVLHTPSDGPSLLPGILARAGPLPVQRADHGTPIRAGHIYVAPPDRHLLVERGRLDVVRGPRENRHRPAIDPLFRSAAWAYGPRVVGVVLTGQQDDGTAGLWAVKSCGGTTVVQDPDEAEYPSMPTNALMHNRIDHRVRLAELPALLCRLADTPVDPGAWSLPTPPGLREEIGFAKMDEDLRTATRLGRPTPFTCPSCHGALWELDEGGHLRYRCHTGHAFSQDSMVSEQGIAMEESLYIALRTVEERAAVLRRLAERWPQHLPGVREDYTRRAEELDRTIDALRNLLVRPVPA